MHERTHHGSWIAASADAPLASRAGEDCGISGSKRGCFHISGNRQFVYGSSRCTLSRETAAKSQFARRSFDDDASGQFQPPRASQTACAPDVDQRKQAIGRIKIQRGTSPLRGCAQHSPQQTPDPGLSDAQFRWPLQHEPLAVETLRPPPRVGLPGSSSNGSRRSSSACQCCSSARALAAMWASIESICGLNSRSFGSNS